MELQIRKQTLSVSEIAFENQTEQPVEYDVILPDYCPDIQRILSCDVCCLVRETKAQQQRVTVEGELRLSVLYVSDSGQLRGIEQKQPFVRHLDSRNPLLEPLIDVQSKVDYLNCRAVSSRRLEVRGAVTLNVQAINCTKTELLADGEGMGLQLKKKMVEMDGCLFGGESSFTLREELELGSHPAVGQILSSRVQAVLTDHKVISGKIVTKGEVRLHLLYQPLSVNENDGPQELDYNIPVSQILNAGGTDDDCSCCVSYQVSGWEIQPKADMDGEMKVLSVEVQIRGMAAVHCPQQLTLVQDAYSTLCPVEAKEKTLSYLNFVSCLQENHRMRESISSVQNPRELLDCQIKIKELRSQRKEDGILLTASATLCALVVDSEGNYQLVEESRTAEHMVSLPAGQKGLIFQTQLIPTAVEGSINSGGQVEIRGQLQLSGSVYTVEQQTALASLELDESCRKENDSSCALCIYYADPQESIWDIGKKYNTSVAGIMEENNLDHDILPQRTMLLIPMY